MRTRACDHTHVYVPAPDTVNARYNSSIPRAGRALSEIKAARAWALCVLCTPYFCTTRIRTGQESLHAACLALRCATTFA